MTHPRPTTDTPTTGNQATQGPRPTDDARRATGVGRTDGPGPTNGGDPTDGVHPAEGSQPTDGGPPTDRGQPTDGGHSTAGAHSPDGGQPAEGGQPTTDGHPTEGPAPLPLPLTPPPTLHAHLSTHLGGAARAWLDQALDEAAAHPGAHGPISVWELRLAEAGRRCGSAYADAVRVLILHTVRADAAALTRVYYQGTGAERRAVLHALPHLVPGPDALPLIEDALRTNDTGLLAAAVGPYAARHLDAHQWRHAVLKCLFTGVSVSAVADLERRARADAELARMLADYAAERTAAGRPVPEDLYRLLALAESGPASSPHGSAHPHGAHPHGAHPHGKES